MVKKTMAAFLPQYLSREAQAGTEAEVAIQDAARQRAANGIQSFGPYSSPQSQQVMAALAMRARAQAPNRTRKNISQADFERAKQSAGKSRKGGSPSRLNDSAQRIFQERRAQEYQERQQRREMASQVRQFKKMARLGYRDPVTFGSAIAPEDMIRFQLAQAASQHNQQMDYAQLANQQQAIESQNAMAMMQLAQQDRQGQNQFSLEQAKLKQLADQFALQQQSESEDRSLRERLAALQRQPLPGTMTDREKVMASSLGDRPDLLGRIFAGEDPAKIMGEVGGLGMQDRQSVYESADGDVRNVERALQMRGLTPQQIAKEFEAITGKSYEGWYKPRQNSWMVYPQLNLRLPFGKLGNPVGKPYSNQFGE